MSSPSKKHNYQSEMAQLIAELDPNFATTSSHVFPANPIRGLVLNDVLGISNESDDDIAKMIADYAFDSDSDSSDFGDIAIGNLDSVNEQQNENNNIVQTGEGASKKSLPLFTVQKSSAHFYQKFQMMGTCYSLDIPQPGQKVVPETWLRQLLNSVISYFKSNSSIEVRSGDKIGLSLRNDNILGSEPIYVSLRRADQLDADVVLEHIMRILDSNKEFFMNGHLIVQFDHIQLPHGTGRVKRQFGQTNAEFILQKGCYLKYKNPFKEHPGDDHCLPYALVIARAYIQSSKGEIGRTFYKNYQRTFSTLRAAAENLCREANVNISYLRGGCSIDEVKMFQRILPTYQIVIYTVDSKKPIHVDRMYNGKSKINIMSHDNHYSAMSNVTACFGAKYICEECHTHTETRAAHFCKYACTQCQQSPKCDSNIPTISCSECHRFFYGVECYDAHLKISSKGSSVCKKKRNSPKCKFFIEKDHECGKRKCSTCEKFVDRDNHLCHIPVYESKITPEMKILYVMFDLETQQDNQLSAVEPNKFKHVANLCVAQSVCTKCLDNSDISIPCVVCGIREHIFYSKKCIEDFMNFIVKKREETEMRCDEITGKNKKCPKFDRIVIIAHNMSVFDGQFILKYIYESDRFKSPSIIMNGTRIIEIKIGSAKFIDSLNYFQVGLSKLPELCGFEGSKGHYPYLMNTEEMKDYIGPKPGKDVYGYNTMTTKAREEFDKWYDKLPSNYIFNNSKELLEYCIQDVTILRRACVKFITEFYCSNGLDPFVEASTVAGICNKVFRSKYMQPDSIGIIPTSGYRLADTQSKFALKYLCSVEMEYNIKIQHAGRGREFKIPGVGRVDGLYRGPINGINSNGKDTVWEMDGCHWHSCTSCNPSYYDDEDNPMFIEFRRRRDRTLAKHKAIRDAGYNLIVKRECDFRRELQSKPLLAAKLNGHPLLVSEPLNPREAFYGGRTNSNISYFKAEGETKVHYVDICSLYPFIQKVSKMAASHPKVHVGDDCKNIAWQNMDGLMKVTIAPPRGLDFPVLPSRMHKKLMFVLCKICAETLNQDRCEHNEQRRELTGTYVIDEVKLAVHKGYEIVKIHEIWEYQVTQYDPVTKKGGFFAEFINHFLKLKAEASCYPKSRVTPEQRKAYIKEFYEKEGVLLDESKIEFNPSRRLMAKIMLNSFWGRFGMRDDLMRTKLIRTGEELRDIILNADLDVHSVIPINDDRMLVNYREKEEVRAPNKTTKAFTTAYARMELYKYLDMLGPDRVIYYDTDGIIYVQKPNDIMPETGEFLGKLTNELERYGLNSFIPEIVAAGPKNYAFRVFSPPKQENIELSVFLDMLASKCVYYSDSDANIFSQKFDEIMLETEEKFLVRLTAEIERLGLKSLIPEIVADSSKNYVFKVFSPPKEKISTVVKVKGITLNYENSQVVNFDLIKSFVTDPSKANDKVVVSNNCIRRTNTADVYSTRVPKTYRITYNKRQKTGVNYATIPYGY